jgi:hypothetical protein
MVTDTEQVNGHGRVLGGGMSITVGRPRRRRAVDGAGPRIVALEDMAALAPATTAALRIVVRENTAA